MLDELITAAFHENTSTCVWPPFWQVCVNDYLTRHYIQILFQLLQLLLFESLQQGYFKHVDLRYMLCVTSLSLLHITSP